MIGILPRLHLQRSSSRKQSRSTTTSPDGIYQRSEMHSTCFGGRRCSIATLQSGIYRLSKIRVTCFIERRRSMASSRIGICRPFFKTPTCSLVRCLYSGTSPICRIQTANATVGNALPLSATSPRTPTVAGAAAAAASTQIHLHPGAHPVRFKKNVSDSRLPLQTWPSPMQRRAVPVGDGC